MGAFSLQEKAAEGDVTGGLVVGLVVLGSRLDSIMLRVFCDPNDCVIVYGARCKGRGVSGEPVSVAGGRGGV